MGQKILLSGVKPSGRPHIGNYFGAMKQYVDLQRDYRSFIMIADLHALTTLQNRAEMAEYTRELLIDYLAIGLDPETVTFFKQSDVPAHAELGWIFNCITTMPYLMRAHAFKDAEAKNKEINVGVFDYPMLMAADILLYQADVVPVGADQKQHVEIARDTAEKFNRIFETEVFKLPEPLILDGTAIVPGIDGRKMSKSYDNHIPLFADEKELRRLIMAIQTDSKGVTEPKNPEECTVFAFHKLFSQNDLPELKRRYVEGGIGYKESKDILFENMNAFLAPLRSKRAEIAADQKRITEIFRTGAAAARAAAAPTLTAARRAIGVETE